MTIGTTIPQAKSALRDLLGAHAGLDGVQIVWGGKKQLRNEVVVLGQVRGNQEAAALGQRRREERYSIRLHVNVKQRSSLEDVTERAVAIAVEVEKVLGANPQLGLTAEGILSAQAGDYNVLEWSTGDAAEAEVRIEVEVTARISSH